MDRERRIKAGHVTDERISPAARRRNGWGFVLRMGDMTFYDHGQVPQWFLDHFAARKAFIYVLEIVAQVLPLAAFSSVLPMRWLAFIDNQAGEAALRKGYGKDDAVNGVLTAFWSLAVHMSWDPDFNRVESKANISDAVSRADLTFAQAQGRSDPSTWRWRARERAAMCPAARRLNFSPRPPTRAEFDFTLTCG